MGTDLSEAKRVVTSAYDATAARFSEHAHRLVYTHLAAPLVDVIGDAEPVLDVASGSGAVGERCRDAVAVDLSAGQLATNPVNRRVQADADWLPFRDDSFALSACAFGVNHFPDARAAVAEMARVAPSVAVLTWARPERPYRPKEIVLGVIRRHTGAARTTAGALVDELTDGVGSPAAVAQLLEGAGLRPSVRLVDVLVPWSGAEAFVDYRLSTIAAAGLERIDQLRAEAVAALAALGEDEVVWKARLVLGTGERQRRGIT